jgi:hypothetical protein
MFCSGSSTSIRVLRFGAADALDDLAGQRPDIGAPVAADFRLVVHAAQRNAGELPAQRARNRAPERGLAHAGRPEEAQDRTLGARLHLADGQVVKNALLHLFEVVVILLEDGVRLGDVDVLRAGGLVPRQRGHPLEVSARNHVLGRGRGHFLEPLQLAVALLARLGGHLRLFDLLAQLLDFGDGVVGFAQFLVNRLQLFAQQVFTLALAHLLLDLLLNLRAQLEHFALATQFAHERLQALVHVGRFEQFLPRLRGERRHVPGDEIAQAAGVGHGGGGIGQVVGKLRRADHHLAEQIDHTQLQRFPLGIRPGVHIGQRLNAGAQEGPHPQQFHQTEPVETFEEGDHVAIRHPHQLVHLGERANAVQVGGSGILNARIVLGNDTHKFLFAFERIHQGERRFPADRQGQHDTRKQHGVAYRQDRQFFRNSIRLGHFQKLPWVPERRGTCTLDASGRLRTRPQSTFISASFSIGH